MWLTKIGKRRVVGIISFLSFLICGLGTSVSSAKTIDGFGKLKFGMNPREVEALDGCSSSTECLYEILGKNRYFTLAYGANGLPGPSESPPSSTAKLTHIDIDMGNHTKEWFGELYQVLVAQYPVSYIPTEQEDKQFQDGTTDELIIGFADGTVLLKIVRRPFGNFILRVIYQDAEAAQAQRQHWEQISPQPSNQ